MLTLSCKAVKNTDTNHEVEWKIQFPGTGWKKFFYCRHKSDVRCGVRKSTLPLGFKALSNPDGNATLVRSERNAAYDHAWILCQVHSLSDHSKVSNHLYNVSFTTRCKFSQLVGLLVIDHIDVLVWERNLIVTLIKERGIEALDERQNDRGGRDSNVRRRNRMGAWYHILRHRNSGAWEGGLGGGGVALCK